MSFRDSATATAGATDTRRGLSLLVILIATVIGGFLRFSGLGDRDFWFDESCTYIYVHHFFDWPFSSSFLVESTNTPYYTLLRVWSSFFGETEAGYRSMSAFAASLTVPVIGVTAWRLRGSLAGVVATVLVAVHPLHVYYSREARAYALWMLLLSVSLYALVAAAETGRRRWWLAFGAAMLLSLYTHYFSVYFLIASVACVFLSSTWRRTLRQWAITASVVGLGFVPWMFVAVLPAASRGGAKWVASGFDAVTAIPATLWALLPSGAYPGHLRGLSVASTETVSQASLLVVCARVVPAVLLAFVAAFVLKKGAREARDSRRNGCLFLVCLAIDPLILAWFYAVAVSPNYLVGRYDMVAWPAFVVLCSVVVSELARVTRKGLMFSLVVCAILVGCSAVVLIRMGTAPTLKSLHRQRAEAVASIARKDDLVITLSYDRDAMLYYLRRAESEVVPRSFPRWLDDQIGWIDSQADLSDDRLVLADADAAALATLASQRLERGRRAFLLADSADPEGHGPRGQLHGLLGSKLQAAGLEAALIDDNMLVYEIRTAVAGDR